MVKKSTYKAARLVASTVEKHFELHLSEAIKRGEKVDSKPPKADMIERMIDVSFWASLLKEEGHSPVISLAFLSPEQVQAPLLLEHRLPFNSHSLTKLSPGFERPGIHLGVWYEGDELFIWGATNKIPSYCFVLNVPEPGLLVIKHRRSEEFGKFTNVAVLNGDEIKIVDEKSALLPDCPSLLTSLLGLHNSTSDSVNVLVQVAVSMRSHGRGGTLLIVPSGSNVWRNSIRQPIHYAVTPPFDGLNEMMKQDKKERATTIWQAKLKREVDEIGGLTAIDGAVVINDQYQLLAFGAKIIRSEGSSLVEKVLTTEPIIGHGGVVVPPGLNEGTRHLSAAQFVNDQKEALALVASQDGKFTVFSWSYKEKMVQAHRIEVLLL